MQAIISSEVIQLLCYYMLQIFCIFISQRTVVISKISGLVWGTIGINAKILGANLRHNSSYSKVWTLKTMSGLFYFLSNFGLKSGNYQSRWFLREKAPFTCCPFKLPSKRDGLLCGALASCLSLLSLLISLSFLSRLWLRNSYEIYFYFKFNVISINLFHIFCFNLWQMCKKESPLVE